MIVKNVEQLEMLREGGKKLGAILSKLSDMVRPGISTLALDERAEELIRASGGLPVFKNYKTTPKDPPYPGSICVSINHEVVHGIPRADRVLQEGDIVGIDIGMRWPAKHGLVTDTARTVAVGQVSDDARRLVETTRRALEEGIRSIHSGSRLGDLGARIQRVIEEDGFHVIRDLVGHGVGEQLHEDPYVPNYGKPGTGDVLREGMVIAIEPMAVLGNPNVELLSDGWTWATPDESLAAHFEHTVYIGNDGAESITKSL